MAAWRVILDADNANEAERLHNKQKQRARDMERRMEFQHLQLVHRKKDGKLEMFHLPIKYPSSCSFSEMKIVANLSAASSRAFDSLLSTQYPPSPSLRCLESHRSALVVAWEIGEIEDGDNNMTQNLDRSSVLIERWKSIDRVMTQVEVQWSR